MDWCLAQINQDHSTHCPGLYCGRIESDGIWSECGACPRGYRASASSLCLPCQDNPTFYDWLYLGFMALLLLVSEWYIIDQTMQRRIFTTDVISLHFSAFVENVIAAFLTLLLFEPKGSLNITSCKVKRLSDWYTLLHNPTPCYIKTLRCTQEAVYPLYSMVFIHFFFSLVFMLLVRPCIICKFSGGRGKKSIYLSMYLIPGLIVLQATCGGLIYYSFPFVSIILSVISVASHLAFRLDQSMKSLFLDSAQDVRNLVIILGHWILHAYGIVAITQLSRPVLHGSLIALVPFPALFYILTAKFTDPSKLHMD